MVFLIILPVIDRNDSECIDITNIVKKRQKKLKEQLKINKFVNKIKSSKTEVISCQ